MYNRGDIQQDHPHETGRHPGRLANTWMKLCVVTVITVTLITAHAGESLLVYAGSASKPPTEEAARRYQEKTGIRIDLVFGGSGHVLAQMSLAKRGDLYFPGSSDYMEKAKRDGAVFPETEKIIVYLVPAINVQKGNPHRVRSLADLTRPGLRVAIANPDGVCVGAYAVEIIEHALPAPAVAAFRRNLVNYPASCSKTATAISLKQADAVIGWRVFGEWDPERIETVALRASEIPRVGYIPIAISRFTHNREAAQAFIDFLVSPEGRKIFADHHYLATPEAAFTWIGEKKPVGGEYHVPDTWRLNSGSGSPLPEARK